MPWSARTRVHEYGGAAYVPTPHGVFFISSRDNALYLLEPKSKIEKIAGKEGVSWADLEYDPHRDILWAVQEKGTSRAIVRLSIQPNAEPETAFAAKDSFFSSPRISPDGQHLGWLVWRRPFMPWDQSELWTARVLEDGTLQDPQRVLGRENIALVQPQWSATSEELFFLADIDDHGALYRWHEGKISLVATPPGDAFIAHWVFGQSGYSLGSHPTIVSQAEGVKQLYAIQPDGTLSAPLCPDLTDIQYVCAYRDGAAFIGSSFTEPPAIWTWSASRGLEELYRPEDWVPAHVSTPMRSASKGSEVPFFYYPPRNAGAQLTSSNTAKPPLIVVCHGGPTAAVSSSIELNVQFWTSRGFAVAEVNYRGSTGFGRTFRQSLLGNWGIYDVDDCCDVASTLIDQGAVNPRACFIRGSSSGGLTVLRSLMNAQTPFAAGVGYYPVTDLVALAEETHGFEYDYVPRLIGSTDALAQRSPLYAAAEIQRPILLIHGTDDRVVPTKQSQELAEKLTALGRRSELLLLEGEGHGLRKAGAVEKALNAELSFYQSVLSP